MKLSFEFVTLLFTLMLANPALLTDDPVSVYVLRNSPATSVAAPSHQTLSSTEVFCGSRNKADWDVNRIPQDCSNRS